MHGRTLADWLAYQERVHFKSIDLGLDRVSDVARALALTPTFPIITVGGTNGKGSGCAMLEAILSSAGYRVGCYTSPHLLRYNERVRVSRKLAEDAALVSAFEAIEAARGSTPLTYFEYGTLAAMWLFQREAVDVAVLEVGMGGRLDAVNAFDADCALLMSVDLDHQEYLGNTVEAIGREKAGIMRAGKPAVFADPACPQSVIDHAQAIGARLLRAGRDFGFVRQETQWQFWGPRGKHHSLPFPALRGNYQLNNAAGVLATLAELRERISVAAQDIKRGLLDVDIAGRLQLLPGRPSTVLDVAHNPHAAKVLAEALGSMGFAQNTYAVFSMLADKDVSEVVRRVAHRVDAWYIAAIDHPRGSSVEALRAAIEAQAPGKPVHGFVNLAGAYDAATKASTADDRILVFGSFYTVAAVLEARAR